MATSGRLRINTRRPARGATMSAAARGIGHTDQRVMMEREAGKLLQATVGE